MQINSSTPIIVCRYCDYIVGIKPEDVPPIPHREGKPWKTICGITGQPGRRCTQYEREYTPDGLIEFMTKICEKINERL